MKIKLLMKRELTIYLDKNFECEGIHSQITNKEDRHIIMWDFDNVHLDDLRLGLKMIQNYYCLPTIYIVESSPYRYHAYCFASRSFLETISIISSTPYIDVNFIRLGVIRGYFTLRISPRNGKNNKLADTLISKYQNEAEFSELTISKYLTHNGGNHATR